jgi:hypothetical protein
MVSKRERNMARVARKTFTPEKIEAVCDGMINKVDPQDILHHAIEAFGYAAYNHALGALSKMRAVDLSAKHLGGKTLAEVGIDEGNLAQLRAYINHDMHSTRRPKDPESPGLFKHPSYRAQ